MLKNTAGQHVYFQMIAKTDGDDVLSGTPTVYVTIDGGTQATGTGTVQHEGQGQWSYEPTAAETNGDNLGFTMVLGGAVSQTVNASTVVEELILGVSTLDELADAVWRENRDDFTYTPNQFGYLLDQRITAAGSGGGCPGPGTIQCTWDVTETGSGDPIQGVSVWITTDAAGSNVIAGVITTDAFGQARFLLDAGTVYVWTSKAGYNFTNPTTVSVIDAVGFSPSAISGTVATGNAYTTEALVKSRFGTDNIDKWADLENTGVPATITARINQEIEYASREIDGLLMGRDYYYTLPFNPVPNIIEDVATSLSGYRLWQARGIEAENDVVQNAQTTATEKLKRIVNRAIRLNYTSAKESPVTSLS